MVKAQLSDDVIAATINSSAGSYDTSPDALISLKQAGVSDKVIAAVVGKGSAAPAAPPPAAAPAAEEPQPSLPPGVENVGAYFRDSGGNWQPLPSEVVIFQSGGLVKHVASAGLVKEDLNGLIGGTRSRVVVTAPVTFILHVPQRPHRRRLRTRPPACVRQQPPVPIRRRRPHSRVRQARFATKSTSRASKSVRPSTGSSSVRRSARENSVL